MSSCDKLETIDVRIPPKSVIGGIEHPIAESGKNLFKKMNDLNEKKYEGGPAVDLLKKILVGIYWYTGKNIPFAFKIPYDENDKTIRRLNLEWLSYIRNNGYVIVHSDDDGWIDTVEPTEKLLLEYSGWKEILKDMVRPRCCPKCGGPKA